MIWPRTRVAALLVRLYGRWRVWSASAAAGALVLAGLALLPAPFGIAHVMLAAGGLLAILRPSLAEVESGTGTTTVTPGAPGLAAVGDHLEQRLEELKDVAWELRDNEARYRDLLDTQDDVIERRDASGRLTFVNSSFCRVFGVEAAVVLGSRFTPTVLAEDERADGAPDAPRRLFVQHIETRQGCARWFAFEQHLIPGADGVCQEVQTIGRDVTEQRRFEADLAEARDQALAADRAKSRFLAAMSHEIRTPMNGILGMAGLLQDTRLSAEQNTYVGAIDQSAKTLLLLIDEILDFSKVEAGKLVIDPKPFALDACVQGVVELIAPTAYEKGLEMAWTLDPGLPSRVVGDEARVRQILLNLIGNAVKFTDRGGVIVGVEVRSVNEAAIIVAVRIKDTGIGMSEAARRSLFAEFGQADAPFSQRRGGTGLGLAISRRLARAMNGEIEVESETGRGSTFTATLQLNTVPNAVPVLPRAGGANGSDPVCAGVVLAFDRLLERRAMATSLRAAGIPVSEANGTSGEDEIADAIAAVAGFDTLIVDAHDDAEEAGRALALARSRVGDREVRGILLLDPAAKPNLQKFKAAGFASYMVRPVRPHALLARLGILPEHEPAIEPLAVSASRIAPVAEGIRVLLAEDNAVNALLARVMLEKSGCEVVHVTDGVQAVEAVAASLDSREQRFDLLLMDIHMPRLDGLQAAAEIRRLVSAGSELAERLPRMVALTANAFAEDRERCLAAGLDDYLAKPFQKSELTSLLSRLRIEPVNDQQADAAA